MSSRRRNRRNWDAKVSFTRNTVVIGNEMGASLAKHMIDRLRPGMTVSLSYVTLPGLLPEHGDRVAIFVGKVGRHRYCVNIALPDEVPPAVLSEMKIGTPLEKAFDGGHG